MEMGIGIYLTKGVLDIFDNMEKLKLKKTNSIINALKGIWNNVANYVEIVTLNKENVTVEVLKSILNKKYSDKDLIDFVKVFSNFHKSNQNINTSMGNNKNQIDRESLQLKFTDDFWIMLDKIDDVVSWSIIELDQNPDVRNRFGIDKLDVSDDDFYFDCFYENGNRGRTKIIEFINLYLPNKFTKSQIYDFVRVYNKVKNVTTKSQDVIEVPPFKLDPKDVRSTFISLVTETYPMGWEEEVLQFLPQDLEKDKYGNLFKIIGKSDTLFTCHLDTASRDKQTITLLAKKKNDQEYIMSDGTTILGADDKAGVTVIMYMMAHNVPGIYYFFLGEERGGIGSGKVADDIISFPFLKDIKKVVAFDRRNYYSVITSQMCIECCSDEFGQSLCDELNKGGLKLGLDPTGVFTDSANFIDHFPECTNISVGYFNEHTHDEIQNMDYLIKLAKACVAADWSKLVVKRKIGFDSDLLEKWSDLLKDIKESAFYNDVSPKGVGGKIIIMVEFDDVSLSNAYDDLTSLETIMMMHRCNPNVTFDGNVIKIEIG